MISQQDYWNQAAEDKDVDIKYICDVPLQDCLKDLLPIKGEVLEIGCGVGRLMQDGWHGCDISEKMLKIAKSRKPKLNLKLIKNGKLDYKPDTFDNVYAYLVFQHIEDGDVISYISQAYNLLKKGGVFQFQFINGYEDEPFSKHRPTSFYIGALYDAGFRTIEHKNSKAHLLWTICKGTK